MKLHHHSIGSGPDLVLLHGWGLHSAIWSAGTSNLIELLSAHYRLTLIDLPGHGLSNNSDDGFSFDAAAAAIAALLPETTILLGWSLGGLLAQRLAQQRPQQISQLILLASTARFSSSRDWPAALPAATLRDFGTALLTDQRRTVQRFLALQVHGSDNERQQLQQLRLALAERPAASAAALSSGLDILQQIDLRPQLATISQPTLLIFGQHDRIVPATVAPAMRRQIPRAKSLIIKGAGHAPFLSHPLQTGQAIVEFLHD